MKIMDEQGRILEFTKAARLYRFRYFIDLFAIQALGWQLFMFIMFLQGYGVAFFEKNKLIAAIECVLCAIALVLTIVRQKYLKYPTAYAKLNRFTVGVDEF